ncbi:MAG: GNAT family N-acetyltransferase [Ruminococcus sp.]|nr:GNAT family N-acetyltransferase [Ruminococcus sp.]
MIKLIEHEHELDRELLLRSISGRKMLAYMRAYGPNYEFCRFYKITDENGIGFMFIINSTLIICSDDNLEATEEIDLFINMNIPFRIEGSQKILEKINNPERYQKLNRTVFELIPDNTSLESIEEHVDFNPHLPEVYKILSEGFPNIADFSLWYTDTSHRCRHGISRVFTYRNSTTASIMFDIENVVLIGQVATKTAARGSGYAREFLRWLAQFLNGLGKRAYLLALDVRVSFYREIGFREVESEIVLERIDVEKESVTKGKLEDEQ